MSGECHSPSANRLRPGDILWSVTSSTGLSDSLVMDDGGNTYVRTSGSQLVSFDACGRERWRSSLAAVQHNNGSSTVMLSSEAVIVFQHNRVAAFTKGAGTLLWSRSIRALFDVCERSFQPCEKRQVGSFFFTAATISQSDKIRFVALTALKNGAEYQSTQMFGQLSVSGQLEWQRQFSGMTNTRVLLVEGPGETLSFAGPDRRSFDINGNSVVGPVPWGGYAATPFAVGADAYLSMGNSGWMETTPFDGGTGASWTLPADVPTNAAVREYSVIDQTGTVYTPGSDLDGGWIQAVARSGVTRKFRVGAGAVDVLLASADGSVFTVEKFGTAVGGPRASLLCLDAATGTRRWAVPLNSSYVYGIALTLSPDGMLVLQYNSELLAVWTGRAGFSASAPWPKYGGNNANASRRHGAWP